MREELCLATAEAAAAELREEPDHAATECGPQRDERAERDSSHSSHVSSTSRALEP